MLPFWCPGNDFRSMHAFGALSAMKVRVYLVLTSYTPGMCVIVAFSAHRSDVGYGRGRRGFRGHAAGPGAVGGVEEVCIL